MTKEFDYHMDHPERLPDEIFTYNYSPQEAERLPYNTKRIGNVAYSAIGGRIASPKLVPVFVKFSEAEGFKELNDIVEHFRAAREIIHQEV